MSIVYISYVTMSECLKVEYISKYVTHGMYYVFDNLN